MKNKLSFRLHAYARRRTKYAIQPGSNWCQYCVPTLPHTTWRLSSINHTIPRLSSGKHSGLSSLSAPHFISATLFCWGHNISSLPVHYIQRPYRGELSQMQMSVYYRNYVYSSFILIRIVQQILNNSLLQQATETSGVTGTSTTTSTGTITEEHIRASLISAVSDRVRAKLRDSYGGSQAEVSVLRQQQADLNQGKIKLEGLISKLEQEQVSNSILSF